VGFTEFCTQLSAEMRSRGLEVDVPELMARIAPAIAPRPSMVRAVHSLREAGMKTAALTNNWREADGSDPLVALRPLFDVVVESSQVGLRKPEPEIYHLVCDQLGITPDAAVFLDDLGPNLKPARQMGMATIKVVTPEQALTDLEQVLGLAPGALGV
jgi:epoxide hydrolase-like predicted phosphatase